MSIINNIDWIITFNIYPSGRNRTFTKNILVKIANTI